jgi:hypothetical protein
VVTPVVSLHELSAGTELPFPLGDQELELLVLPAHAAVVLLLAAHAHPLLAEWAARVVVLDEAAWDVAETVFPGAVCWVWGVEFCEPEDEAFEEGGVEVTVLADCADGDGGAAAAELASGFEHGDNSIVQALRAK